MSRDRAATRLLVSALTLTAVGLTGCVERRYTIRTNVPAVAYVNGEEIGPTPASRSFVYHGDREIILTSPGHQTLRVIQPVDPPWWDNRLTEFFTENLIPFTFRDERTFQYDLAPTVNPPVGDLVGRAEALRREGVAPPPPRRGGLLSWFGF